MGENLKFYEEVQYRGRVSLVCGVLAIITIIVGRLDGTGPMGFAVYFQIFSGIGLLFGVLAVLAKEKRRRVARAGLILNGAPWLFGFIAALVEEITT